MPRRIVSQLNFFSSSSQRSQGFHLEVSSHDFETLERISLKLLIKADLMLYGLKHSKICL